jgi:transposase InsO family protein/transposase-like protein
LCEHTGSAAEVAESVGVTRAALYDWKTQLLGKGMPERLEPEKEQSLEELRLEVDGLKAEAESLRKDVYRLRMERDILVKTAEIVKKGPGVNPEELTNREKTVVIDALREVYALQDLLGRFGLARSSYFYQRTSMSMRDKYSVLREEVKAIFAASQGRYGSRRIHAVLAKTRVISEKVVRGIMKVCGLVAKGAVKKKRKWSSYQGEVSPAPSNLLERDFHASAPNEKWLTDITEFHIPAGKVYLSPIIDCFDGLVPAWSIGMSPTAELANSSLRSAIEGLSEGAHPIIHSDRGGHYRWPGWIALTGDAELRRSMSKKGCSPDNAACEGFFGRLKNEIWNFAVEEGA